MSGRTVQSDVCVLGDYSWWVCLGGDKFSTFSVCVSGRDWFTAVGFPQGPSILPDKKGFRSPRSGRSSTISTTGKQKTILSNEKLSGYTLIPFLLPSLHPSLPPSLLPFLPPSFSSSLSFSPVDSYHRSHRRTLSNTSNISRVSFSSDNFCHYGDRSSVSHVFSSGPYA